MIKGASFNGPSFHSPSGGRLTELLVAGATLANVVGSHNGTTGNVPPQPIPAQVSLLGVRWAAQYIVAGGGFVDLSRAVRGAIGRP
jgi:hypothetical protein